MSFQFIASQMMVGLINGSFYAVLSLGLALIFGMLHIVNFAHGAFYMLGAIFAWLLLTKLGIGYWWALLLSPAIVGLIGILIQRLLLQRLANEDPIYGLLLTFGLTLMIQSFVQANYGSAGLPYNIPKLLSGGWELGSVFLPIYRVWIIGISIVACFTIWYAIERTRLGSYLRATTEDQELVLAFGINVPLLVGLTFGAGAALAGFAGVLAAPIYSVSPQMGVELLAIVFAVVVIGGMGSIVGVIVSGYGMGLIEGVAKVFYPEASSTIIFAFMILILSLRPQGLFGKY
ncbi:Branched-chain amino acid ABC transporter permease [Hyphomicrobiales bacterium]|nr:Branched-chain amino acid ABC transporter permease [Hyphomicrobiales bacterium]CAH1675645.1 Branched-chain amino acid ABC transporter permease [Hyphomicrobiales bacterium]